jgi:hypothetical protein
MTLTRQSILDDYAVDANKIIRSPGKFEGEPLYVPYFWDCATQGMYAEDVNGVFFMPLDESDHAMFPELYLNTWDGVTDPTNKPAYGIALEESEQGFVYSKVYDTQAEYNAAIEEMTRNEAAQEDSECLPLS